MTCGGNPMMNHMMKCAMMAGNPVMGKCGKMMDKPVLTYFDATGLGEQTRICFLIGNVPFEDRRVTHESWEKHYKAYSPTGRAPYVEVGGKVLTDSQGVLQYAARRAGLMPSNPEDAFKASMVIEMMESDLKKMRQEIPETDSAEEYMKHIMEYVKKDFPVWCDKYEAFFKSWMDEKKGDEFLIGNKLSYLDVYVAASIYRSENFTGTKMIPDEAKFPMLSKVYRNIMENPRVAAYVEEQKRKKAKVVLYHFGWPGFADAIQWAMKIGKIDYESKVVSKEEWENGLKAHSPSGKLPMLEVNGEKYVESVAILQYVAKLAGLVPEGNLEAAHALAVVKLCSEIKEAIGRVRHCQDPELKKAMTENTVAVHMPEMIARLEEVLGQHQDCEGHVVSKSLSYADLWVASTFGFIKRAAERTMKATNLETIAPKMFQTFRMVHAIPTIAAYKSERMTKVKPVLTYFNMKGRGEALRYAMHMAGIDFEDRRISQQDWATIYKPMSPTGQCPFLTVGKGQTIVESKAIMQWILEVEPKLKPASRMDRVAAESLVSASNNIDNAVRELFGISQAERDAKIPQIRDENVAPCLAIQEHLWSSAGTHKGYSIGDKMTYVDCWIAGKMEALKSFGLLADNWKEAYPTVAAVYDGVINHPKVAAYRSTQYP